MSTVNNKKKEFDDPLINMHILPAISINDRHRL